jgi:hypothetical protein
MPGNILLHLTASVLTDYRQGELGVYVNCKTLVYLFDAVEHRMVRTSGMPALPKGSRDLARPLYGVTAPLLNAESGNSLTRLPKYTKSNPWKPERGNIQGGGGKRVARPEGFDRLASSVSTSAFRPPRPLTPS